MPARAGHPAGLPAARLLHGSWALSTAVYSLSLTVTLLYWTTIRPLWTLNLSGDHAPSYTDVFGHLLQTLVMLLEQWTSRRRWQLGHSWLALPVPIAWLVFCITYWAAGGTNCEGEPWIYPVLKWGSSPGASAGWVVVAVVAALASHLLLWGLTRARDGLHRRIWPGQPQIEDIDTE